MKYMLGALCLAVGTLAMAASPPRPPITGVSHIALYAANSGASEKFYVHDLGATQGDDTENARGIRYYFAATQFVEVLPLPSGPPSMNRLDHVAFVTADAEALRMYLASKHVQVPTRSQHGSDGSQWFDVVDPEGNKIEFVQPPPAKAAAAQPATAVSQRLSDHIIHVGFIIHDRAREDSFFRDILGFKPYWFGGMADDKPTWISLQVPDGTDWLEYMVVGTPEGRGIPADMTAADLGVLDHFSLGVSNIEAAYGLLWNGDRLAGQDNVPKIGRDAKWQLNLLDPDGTRAEVMEFHAIGKPCCSPFTAADPACAAAKIDKATIDAALSGIIQSKALVGVSALVYQDGHEAYFGAFGQADREAGKPMTRDTLVQIFSMTKPITGVALMTLFEAGKFQLDDPLAKYAPEFAHMRVYAGIDAHGDVIYEAPHRPITIRDITRHTAGFFGGNDHSPVGEMYRAADPANVHNTLAEEAQKLGSLPLLFQPGSRWLYGPSVDVQALLVERLSGMPFDQYLQKMLFNPLGMKNTRYVLRPEDRDRIAAMYDWHEDGSLTRESDEESLAFNAHDWPMKPGSYGLVSTLDDYMRFARMLQNGGELEGHRILKPETIRLMATDAMPKEVTDTSWLSTKGRVGFGIDFAVRTKRPADAQEASGEIGEFFWDGAADTLFWVDPKNKITAVLFTQYKPFGKVPLHKAFRDAVYHNVPDALAH